MRLLFLILMIALLPLRGWAGEVMATEMASSQMTKTHLQRESAMKSGAAHAYNHWSAAVFEGQKAAIEVQKLVFEAKDTPTAAMHDCEGHATADASGPVDGHCDSCSACQACHSVALSPAVVSLSLGFSSPCLPRRAAAHFASAAAALGQKPPIS